MQNLPDLDTLNTSDLAKLTDAARAEQATLERIYAALTVATNEDKLRMAALAVLNVSECQRFELLSDDDDPLLANLSDEALISVAIAILEGIQSSEEDAIAPPDCEFDE